jgi:hypothetical protein
MDGRALMQYAAARLSPGDANKIIEESDLVFLVGSQWVKFHEGQMYAENGTPVSTGMSGVTDVAHLDTLRAARRNRPEGEGEGEPVRPSDDQLRAAGVQNVQHNISRTIPTDAVKEHGSGPFVRNGTQHLPEGASIAREPLVIEQENASGTPMRPTDERGRSNPTTVHPAQQLSPEAQALLDKSKGTAGPGEAGSGPGQSKPGTSDPGKTGTAPNQQPSAPAAPKTPQPQTPATSHAQASK